MIIKIYRQTNHSGMQFGFTEHFKINILNQVEN